MGKGLAESLRVALASVRANAVAMATLWLVAAATVAAYYLSPAFAAALEPLKTWQTESGWIAAALNRIAFCGLLPGVFLCTVKSIRPPRPPCAWRAARADGTRNQGPRRRKGRDACEPRLGAVLGQAADAP